MTFDTSCLFGPFAEIERLSLPDTRLSPPFEGVLGVFYTKLVTKADEDSRWFADNVGSPHEHGALDLCCGGGRSVLELAKKGWRVTGVDRSVTQLSAARTLLSGAGEDVSDRVSLVRGDVTSLALSRTFGAVVIGGLSLTLFDVDRRSEVLASARRHLRDGGRLLFDYVPVAVGEQNSEATMVFPVRTTKRTGFVLVGARREPRRRRQLTNLYAELVAEDGHTSRALTGFEFRLTPYPELEAELAGHEFVVTGIEREQVDGLDDAASPFGTRQYVTAEVAA
ncbi:SAM-dependent methyltransferase [Prauserella cavernicola]|uniref:Class I SAM-dependent methyltransferase n=1 Tax=Prauserella cavernicola TaxID=2800127 RepID=A0A934QZ83_9PSEU|nr:class I SAM-dependent methyltransferase [Prauserella cavernicola]MBK1787988.1 class I SAM-dependent methyltransferase [Prauserella cavernicola]